MKQLSALPLKYQRGVLLMVHKLAGEKQAMAIMA